ncbi:MAG TPA: histidine triad nucleotide-binding protein [Mycobacteriales bacterium]|nr:histidine triad nucleotide-binding protein [Mycobacteriales bacterium]
MTEDCLFCRIAAGDVPAEVVAGNDHAIAFRDISPVAPTHVLVIPRAHHPNAAAVAEADPEALIGMVRLAKQVAADEGIADDGYRLVANTGAAAHQTVFHAHLHVLGGRPMGWPPG